MNEYEKRSDIYDHCVLKQKSEVAKFKKSFLKCSKVLVVLLACLKRKVCNFYCSQYLVSVITALCIKVA